MIQDGDDVYIRAARRRSSEIFAFGFGDFISEISASRARMELAGRFIEIGAKGN
jgi:hypothetical protein